VIMEPQLLRIAEAAALMNVSRSTAYEMAQRGQLPGVLKFGRALRVSRRALEQWIDANIAPADGLAR
jgi:excisionase family DNA binding protein